MADEGKRRGLGRGLSALIGDVAPAPSAAGDGQTAPSAELPIDLIDPNPDQPRRRFDEDDLNDLAASIRERGVIQPVILRRHPTDKARYQIVAGERRWRAAQLARLHQIPAIVRDLSDVEVLELAIVENVQRADLNPVEEAAGYGQLIETFSYTQQDVGKIVGKSRSHIANALRLLTLPDEVLAHLREGRLSAGHARALITAANPGDLARQVIAKSLSVRETEKLAKSPEALTPQAAKSRKPEKDPDTRILEGELSAALGMRVAIDHQPGANGGEVRVRFKSLDQLDEICQRLSPQ
jgi:ParB family chromosome partitioning protein